MADVSKGQTDMSYKRELQTLTKLSRRNQVCPGETCRTTKSESTITMLMSRSRSIIAVLKWIILFKIDKLNYTYLVQCIFTNQAWAKTKQKTTSIFASKHHLL